VKENINLPVINGIFASAARAYGGPVLDAKV
jgi:hypothetical protein